MLPTKKLGFWLSCMAGSLLLSACGIRFPVESATIHPATVRSQVAATAAAEPDEVPVWLISDTFHTSMAFSFEWLADSGFIAPEDFGNPRYVIMSWGNTDAYSTDGIGGPTKLLRVILTPTPSVLEIIPVNWHLQEVCPDQRIWQRQTPRQYGPALAQFMNQCVSSTTEGEPVVVRPSTWGNGFQLESKHRYYIPRVCNIWSAQAIEAIGGKINPWFAVTASGLIRQAEKPPNNFELIWTGEQPAD